MVQARADGFFPMRYRFKDWSEFEGKIRLNQNSPETSYI